MIAVEARRLAAAQLAGAIARHQAVADRYGRHDPHAVAEAILADLADPTLAGDAGQTVQEICLRPADEHVDVDETAWWASPLGREVGRALGRLDDDDVEMSVAAAARLLDVDRSRVYQLLRAGRLVRGPAGRVLRRTVGAQLAAADAWRADQPRS